MMIGNLHPPRTLFLRIDVGSAEGPNGSAFELTLNAGDNSPIVCSQKTGRWFTLPWEDIINLALEAGIEKDELAPEAFDNGKEKDSEKSKSEKAAQD